MIDVIGALMEGDTRMVPYFAKSKAFWDKFFAENRRADEDTLARALSDAQWGYEALWDHNRGTAKSTMPFTALAALYDQAAGFDENRDLALRTVRAFQKSMVSIEVKSKAEDAAQLYGLRRDL